MLVGSPLYDNMSKTTANAGLTHPTLLIITLKMMMFTLIVYLKLILIYLNLLITLKF